MPETGQCSPSAGLATAFEGVVVSRRAVGDSPGANVQGEDIAMIGFGAGLENRASEARVSRGLRSRPSLVALAVCGALVGLAGVSHADVGPASVDVYVPPPVLAKAVDVNPVSGQVFVELPAGTAAASAPSRGWDGLSALWPAHTAQVLKGRGFVPLSSARQLPVGSLVDTSRGTVALTTATVKPGQVQTGNFDSGVFQILQKRADKGLAELRIRDTQSTSSCARVGQATAFRLSSHTLGLLKGNAHGRFRTRGKFSSSTVRGTQWGVHDQCNGTLTVVQRGVVVVQDFRRQKTINVPAGKTYLAKAH
jgi:hypothetical protein